MARPKKEVEEVFEELIQEDPGNPVMVHTPLPGKLTLDYPSEQLNDLARTINQVIDHLNG